MVGASPHAQILSVGMQMEGGRMEPTAVCQCHNWSCTSCQHLGKTPCEWQSLYNTALITLWDSFLQKPAGQCFKSGLGIEAEGVMLQNIFNILQTEEGHVTGKNPV